MTNRFDFQRFAQITIILLCAAFLAFQFSIGSSQAQFVCWPNDPPFSYPPDPQYDAWPEGMFVPVTIFDVSNTEPTSEADFNAIDAGIRDWNTISYNGCSFVTHGEAIRANRAWRGQSEAPSYGSIYVVRTTDRSGQFLSINNSSVGVIGAWLYLHSSYTSQTSNVNNRLDNIAKHEAGHGFGLENGAFGAPASAMGENSHVNGNLTITQCDIHGHKRVYCPVPTPTPSPESTPGYCNGPTDVVSFPPQGCATGYYPNGGICTRSEQFINQCEMWGGYDEGSCGCTGSCNPNCSPIVVDVLGNGFSLTNVNNGVNFDLDNNGSAERLSWISSGSDDAWLALDRNYDGVIDKGKELFGNVTPQEPPGPGEELNGFRALAIFDQVGYGGNNDGKINHNDAIFDRLRLWQDSNHDGVSETCELSTLPQLGLRRIDLDYRASQRVDAHGNQFKYRSRVYDNDNNQLGRWAWDVFLVVQQP